MNIPAVCDCCRANFPSNVHLTDTPPTRFSGVIGPRCPECGHPGRVPDGDYHMIEWVLTVTLADGADAQLLAGTGVTVLNSAPA